MSGQEKLEKVIYTLECHAFDEYKSCKKCSYLCREDDTATLPIELVMDALALLKAQEPRVMSEVEVAAWNRTKRSIREPVYVEHRDSGEVFAYSVSFGGTCDYGVTWRCWTSRPTDDQREKVKWE